MAEECARAFVEQDDPVGAIFHNYRVRHRIDQRLGISHNDRLSNRKPELDGAFPTPVPTQILDAAGMRGGRNAVSDGVLNDEGPPRLKQI